MIILIWQKISNTTTSSTTTTTEFINYDKALFFGDYNENYPELYAYATSQEISRYKYYNENWILDSNEINTLQHHQKVMDWWGSYTN